MVGLRQMGSRKRPFANEEEGDGDGDTERKASMAVEHFFQMLVKLGKDIWKTGSRVDLVIRVPLTKGSTQYAEIKAHKVILALRASQLSGKIFEKARNGKVTLEDLTEKGLRILLKYIYTARVDEEWSLVAEELANAAEEYQLTELVNFLEKRRGVALIVAKRGSAKQEDKDEPRGGGRRKWPFPFRDLLKRAAKDMEALQMLMKLGTDIGSGLEEESGADLTIRVPFKKGSTQYAEMKVHKVILALRAPQLSGKIFEKARNGRVTLEDMTEKGLKVLLKYIYSSEVDEEWPLVAEELGNAAVDYQLTELVTYLKENLAEATVTEENVGNLFRLAKKFEMEEAEGRIVVFAKTLSWNWRLDPLLNGRR